MGSTTCVKPIVLMAWNIGRGQGVASGESSGRVINGYRDLSQSRISGDGRYGDRAGESSQRIQPSSAVPNFPSGPGITMLSISAQFSSAVPRIPSAPASHNGVPAGLKMPVGQIGEPTLQIDFRLSAPVLRAVKIDFYCLGCFLLRNAAFVRCFLHVRHTGG